MASGANVASNSQLLVLAKLLLAIKITVAHLGDP
jgi:hypothetical protein